MKEELGLDHFEGRSWRGLHHHALLTMMALCFLQSLRLGGKSAAPADPPSDRLPGPGGAAPGAVSAAGLAADR